MDDKTLTAVSTTLALFQIQVNALLLLLERQGRRLRSVNTSSGWSAKEYRL